MLPGKLVVRPFQTVHRVPSQVNQCINARHSLQPVAIPSPRLVGEGAAHEAQLRACAGAENGVLSTYAGLYCLLKAAQAQA